MAAVDVRLQLAITYAFVRSIERHARQRLGIQTGASAELALSLFHGGSAPHQATATSLARDWANYKRPAHAGPVRRGMEGVRKRLSWRRLRLAAERAVARYGWTDERLMPIIRARAPLSSDEMLTMEQELERLRIERRGELERAWDVATDALLQQFQHDRAWFNRRYEKVVCELGAHDAIEGARASARATELYDQYSLGQGEAQTSKRNAK